MSTYSSDFDSPSSSKFFSQSGSSFGDSEPSLGGLDKSDAAGNAELQEFLAAEQQKAQLRAQVSGKFSYTTMFIFKIIAIWVIKHITISMFHSSEFVFLVK